MSDIIDKRARASLFRSRLATAMADQNMTQSGLARLIREYDALCVKSGVTPGRIKPIMKSNDPDKLDEEVHNIADKLTDAAQLDQTRIRLIPPLPVKGETVEDRLSIEIGE